MLSKIDDDITHEKIRDSMTIDLDLARLAGRRGHGKWIFVTAVFISQIFTNKLNWGDRAYYGRQTGVIRQIFSFK